MKTKRSTVEAVLLLVAVAGFSNAAAPDLRVQVTPFRAARSATATFARLQGGSGVRAQPQIEANPLSVRTKVVPFGGKPDLFAANDLLQTCDHPPVVTCAGPDQNCDDTEENILGCCAYVECAFKDIPSECGVDERVAELRDLCENIVECDQCAQLHTDGNGGCVETQCCDFVECIPPNACITEENRLELEQGCVDDCDYCLETYLDSDSSCTNEQCCDLLECTGDSCLSDEFRTSAETVCSTTQKCDSCFEDHLDSESFCYGLECCDLLDCVGDDCLNDEDRAGNERVCQNAMEDAETPPPTAKPTSTPKPTNPAEEPAPTTKPPEEPAPTIRPTNPADEPAPTVKPTSTPVDRQPPIGPPLQTQEPAPEMTSGPIGGDGGDFPEDGQSNEPEEDDCVATGRLFDNTTSLHTHMSARLQDFRVQRRVREGVLLCVSLSSDGSHVCATANHLFQLDNQYLSLREVCAMEGWKCFTAHDQYTGVKWDTSAAGYLQLGNGLYLTPHSSHSGRRVHTFLSGRADWLLRLLTI